MNVRCDLSRNNQAATWPRDWPKRNRVAIRLVTTCILLVVSLPVHASAKALTIDVQVNPTEVFVAQPVEVTVRIESEPGVTVTPPIISDTFGDLTVHDLRTTPDIPAGNGNRLRVMSFQLEANTPGDYTLPALTAIYTDPRGDEPATGEARTEPIGLMVQSVLETPEAADPTRFRDIKGAVAVASPETFGMAWIWIAGGSVAALALAGVGLVMSRRRTLTGSPRQRALEALRELEASSLLPNGQADAYYSQLTAILRQYIEEVFDLRAARQTTPEFLKQAESASVLGDSDRRMLRECLTAADMVKFARFHPAADADAGAITAVRTFIETPREPRRENGAVA